MQIKISFKDSVAIISLKGDLMGDPETTELREKVYGLLNDGFVQMVMDVSKVKWINSSGLGALISSLTSVKNKGGDLRVAHLTEKVKNLFVITQLVKVFKTYESVDRAVASFKVDKVKGTMTEKEKKR